jgi:chromosomal replication initiator protein
MISKKNQIWDRVRKHLQSQIPDSDFRRWFSQTSLREFHPQVATLAVPNKFFANWISEKYLTLLTESFSAVLNESPRVKFYYERPLSAVVYGAGTSQEKLDSYPAQDLNPQMTFGEYITGQSNRFACTSALQVANSPSDYYNPLYIYCGLGLGKTHLLHAIGNYLISKDISISLKYIPSHRFSSDFTHASKSGALEEFRRAHSNLDFLLLDDVQFLVNRKAAQDEFLSIFNQLYSGKTQMVLTGNAPPNELKNMSQELQSRLGCGLVAEIQPPNHDTKIHIIRQKAKQIHLNLTDDVIFFLANSTNNIKPLLRNLTRLEAYASLNDGRINISIVKSIVCDREDMEIDITDIKSAVCRYFDIYSSDLVSNKKKKVYSYPRQMAMYLSRKYTDLSFKEIAEVFGRKEHSTIIYGVKRIENQKGLNRRILKDIEMIEKLLGVGLERFRNTTRS